MRNSYRNSSDLYDSRIYEKSREFDEMKHSEIKRLKSIKKIKSYR